MEILNALWTSGVIVLVAILLVFTVHYLRRGNTFKPEWRFGIFMILFVLGNVFSRGTIVIWHQFAVAGHPIPLEDGFYPWLALGCIFAISGLAGLMRLLPMSFWGWPACIRAYMVWLVLAAVLIALPVWVPG